MNPRQKLERKAIEKRLNDAQAEAESLIASLGITKPPIDPVEIAKTEGRQLHLCPGNYKDSFDGFLEFDRKQRLFHCYYNTKYDEPGTGRHAPRTRFSLAHELGHYFIESHHMHLRNGGKTHRSFDEFQAPTIMEWQADSFAAHLLMPDRLIKRYVNDGDLSVQMVQTIAEMFDTSYTSTALRAAECSDYCCATAAIRDGRVSWMRVSKSLIAEKLYPRRDFPIHSGAALEAWEAFRQGDVLSGELASWANDWFASYRNDTSQRLPVTETYLPVRNMKTLIVILSIPEDEHFDDVD